MQQYKYKSNCISRHYDIKIKDSSETWQVLGLSMFYFPRIQITYITNDSETSITIVGVSLELYTYT